MKTIFTLLLSSLFTLSSMAYDGTRLTVTSINTSSKIFVEVDGRRYNLDRNTVSLSNIRPGVHNVRVLREVKRKNGWNLGIGNKREEVIYSIRATIRNGYHFDILVNRFGKVMIDERRIDFNDEWYNDDDDDYYDRDRNDRNPNDKDYDDGGYQDRNDRDYPNRDDRNYNDRDDRDDRDYNYNRGMNVNDFNQAKETLRKEWFENTRLSTAKQIVDRNYFTSQQVKEMLMLFTFENNKLDLAKYAYGKAVDKNNYSLVNDVFSFNNSKDELARYIRESR